MDGSEGVHEVPSIDGRAGQGKARQGSWKLQTSRASKAEDEKSGELKSQAPVPDRRCNGVSLLWVNQVWVWEEVKVRVQSSEEDSPKCSCSVSCCSVDRQTR